MFGYSVPYFVARQIGFTFHERLLKCRPRRPIEIVLQILLLCHATCDYYGQEDVEFGRLSQLQYFGVTSAYTY